MKGDRRASHWARSILERQLSLKIKKSRLENNARLLDEIVKVNMEEIENLALVQIEKLRLRTIIGINDWERKEKQDVTINIKIRFDAGRAGQSDRIEDTVNYKALTKRIIQTVEQSQFYLLEKLARVILDIAMEDARVVWGSVKVDKPFALRFADSVSIELSDKKR